MATYSLGTPGLGVLAPAQLELAQRRAATVNPLEAIIQGFNQGQALQQLPEQIRQQQLAQQVNNALLQQKLLDIQDPNRAIARELNRQLALKSIDPASGIVRSIPGFEGQAIATPQALLPATQQFIEAGGDPTEFIGMRPPGAPITPIRGISGEATGFAQDFTIPEAVAERKARQEVNKFASQEQLKNKYELEQIEARNKARGFNTYINPKNTEDIRSLDPTERPPEGFMNVKDYFKKGGPGAPSGSGGGGLKTTGEERQKFREGIGVLREIRETIKVADDINKSGKFPGAAQVSVNQFLAKRPQDMPGANLVPGFAEAYAFTQNLSRGLQTNEARDLQMRKAYLSSTILRMQAGLSQTLGESININPYTPSETDTFQSLQAKLNRLEAVTRNSLNDFRLIYPELRDLQIPGLEQGSDGQTQAPSGGRSFATEAQARAAGFKDGDFVIIGGSPGQLIPTTR